MIRKILFILFISLTFQSCYYSRVAWSNYDKKSQSGETIEVGHANEIFFYSQKQNGKENYRFSFCFAAPGSTDKTVTRYDENGNLVEKIEYGFPSGFRLPFDSLSQLNRYALTQKDKEVLDRITTLEKNDSFRYSRDDYAYKFKPNEVQYLFKLSHTNYIYTETHQLFSDTTFDYRIIQYEGSGKKIYENTIGNFTEPQIRLVTVVSERKSKKVIRKEDKIIKEGKHSIFYNR